MGRLAKTFGEKQSESTLRLRAILARTGMERDALLKDARTSAIDCEGLFRLVIREIEETILPRNLTVLSSNGVEAAMVLANSRLLELGLSDATKLPASDSEEQLSALTYAKALRKIGDRGQAVTLKRVGRAAASTTSGASCSAAQLAESGTSLHRGNRLLEFFQVIRPYTKACILDQGSGRGVHKGGQGSVLQQLGAVEQFFAARRAERKPIKKLDRVEPTCTALAISGQLQAITVTDGSDRMTAAIASDDMIAVMNAWQNIFSENVRTHRP